jgi:CYTH domain-containing protein
MKEIERKFLVINRDYRKEALPVPYKQGYIMQDDNGHLRVRTGNGKAVLGFKQHISGFSRWEFEYRIPLADAKEMLTHLCGDRIVEKDRYTVLYKRLLWEIDEFHGRNEGLIVAEVELSSEDQIFEKPAWLGEEVTHDPRYLNVHLARHPFGEW